LNLSGLDLVLVLVGREGELFRLNEDEEHGNDGDGDTDVATVAIPIFHSSAWNCKAESFAFKSKSRRFISKNNKYFIIRPFF